ncbi:MAG TPA: hypothetical protein DEB05_06805 [Firmicutes bacterium]|jgi:uncharacterized protein (TIGR00375 family)|nr:hypothetical protein [Bacillota bacterium]HBT16646.1 hypothetical protein [Bacillota bacterium]
MKFWADLHLHSRYSMATSKDSNPEKLVHWAGRKGLALIGTGDLTHPGWREELRDKLEAAEDGLWKLKKEYYLQQVPAIPAASQVRFVISGEVCTIYKKEGRTRKVHHLILLPGLEAADQLAARLEKNGNIAANGRPIFNLDSRDLLEITLEVSPETIFIPAHIWTPHFSVFGMNSNFNTLQECYEDLTDEIHALETGLSSDPPMNRRLSMFDDYAFISNSDAHSPQKLGREANLFDCAPSFGALREALKKPFPGFLGTVEFFPEEGKYHWDGHRACGLRWHPFQTMEAGGKCPVCGRKVTVGVLHRLEALADREEEGKPPSWRPCERLVPLTRIIAEAEGVGENTKKVRELYNGLLEKLGPELKIIREMPLCELEKAAGALITEGIRRVRQGLLTINPGFDGEYGEVKIFSAKEREAFSR